MLLGTYPSTEALKSGAVSSPRLAFDFAEVAMVHTAFKRTVRALEFDVAELAIATFLQAKAYGKPLVLMPIVIFNQPYPQQAAIVYDPSRGRLEPRDIAGRRVGARTSAVTTVMWVRGILQHTYGVDIDSITWVTFEDPHVAEYKESENVTRAPAGKGPLAMLLDGELDAAILAGKDLADPRVRPLIEDPQAAAADWRAKHGFDPTNHMLVVREDICARDPWVPKAVFDLLMQSRAAAGASADDLPAGLEANRKALETAIEHSVEQRIIPHRLEVDALFNDLTRGLGA
jgi:4,5-dihydroxyphthalate decarboxylase